MNEIKPVVYIVDDDEAVRNSLSMVMQSANLESKTYSSAKDFLNQYDPSIPGCLLLDMRMPEMSGLELQQQLPKLNIHIPIIIMTGYADVPTAVKAMKAGALDFIEKPFNNDDLIERVHHCFDALRMNQLKLNAQRATERLQLLTTREKEVMELLVEGKINKVIAAELGISTRTVEAHRAKIMEKLGVRSLSDIVRIALAV